MRVCNIPGCGTLHPRSSGRCDDCQAKADHAHNTRTSYRTSVGHRRRFRPGVLGRDMICVICHLAVATRADHYPLGRQELEAAGLDPNDPKHGRGLCASCDSKQTAVRQPGGWNNREH